MEPAEDSTETSKPASGTLYVISTPIGNLDDVTLRALRVLEEVDLIAAEDTRHSQKLLQHYHIRKPLTSFHEHNKVQKAPQIIRHLQDGKRVGLISDAGTPAISDPGFFLIREALRERIAVVAIPGVTALIPALILSGLPLHRFAFEGFPPAKKGRKSFFESLAAESRTLIFYESPYRVLKTLSDIEQFFGDRQVAVVRELTKKFEEILRGSVSEVAAQLQNRAIKGEFVIVVEGMTKKVQREKALHEN